ncbi:uncharacterized protein LOC126661952 [Mercurialis annua]|uniref:uncharacterized protein LOC126661952 n=1 Tax=Mercurialis annua TaxID=3986 RepID=UPI00215F0B02|nr:uncharacterized protein LOC126661952 [Mercurialis annua]
MWERSNNLVMSWIQNSVSLPISKSIEWIDLAFEAWLDLESRFSQGDVYRVLDIQEELSGFKQNTLTVVEYYTHLKEMWDELTNLRPLSVCSCDPQCKCGIYEKIKKYRDNDAVINFLKGLNENFDTIRSQKPIAFYNKVDECTETPKNQNNGSHNSYQKKGNSFSNYKKFLRTSNLKCVYCGNGGHIVDRCYKKHGCPFGFNSGFKGKGKSQHNSYANQVEHAEEDNTSNDHTENYVGSVSNENFTVNNPMQLTQDQYSRLMKLLYQSNISPPMINTVSTTFAPTGSTSGKISLSCFDKCASQKEKWIVDSGATDHIICSLDYFSNYKMVSNCFVHFPNNQKA